MRSACLLPSFHWYSFRPPTKVWCLGLSRKNDFTQRPKCINCPSTVPLLLRCKLKAERSKFKSRTWKCRHRYSAVIPPHGPIDFKYRPKCSSPIPGAGMLVVPCSADSLVSTWNLESRSSLNNQPLSKRKSTPMKNKNMLDLLIASKTRTSISCCSLRPGCSCSRTELCVTLEKNSGIS